MAKKMMKIADAIEHIQDTDRYLARLRNYQGEPETADLVEAWWDLESGKEMPPEKAIALGQALIEFDRMCVRKGLTSLFERDPATMTENNLKYLGMSGYDVLYREFYHHEETERLDRRRWRCGGEFFII